MPRYRGNLPYIRGIYENTIEAEVFLHLLNVVYDDKCTANGFR